MSDDTPTQRFPEPNGTGPTTPIPPASGTPPTSPPGNDAPTQRFEPPAPPQTPGATGGDEEPPKKSKALLITLISIGAALLIAIIILLILLFTSGQPKPSPTSASPSISASATPSASPSTSASPSEPAALPGPSIASFTGEPTTVDCSGGGANAPVTFAWQTTGTTLWFAEDTNDASDGTGTNQPTTSTLVFNYQCGRPTAQQVYTITVQGENGQKVSQSLIIRETD